MLVYSRKFMVFPLLFVFVLIGKTISFAVAKKFINLDGVIFQHKFWNYYEWSLGLGGGYYYDSEKEESKKHLFIPPIIPLGVHLAYQGQVFGWRLGELKTEFGKGLFPVNDVGGLGFNWNYPQAKYKLFFGGRSEKAYRAEKISGQQDEELETRNVDISGFSVDDIRVGARNTLGFGVQSYDEQGLIVGSFSRLVGYQYAPFVEIGSAAKPNEENSAKKTYEVYGRGNWGLAGLVKLYGKVTWLISAKTFLKDPAPYSRPERPFFNVGGLFYLKYQLSWQNSVAISGQYLYDTTQNTGWQIFGGEITHLINQKLAFAVIPAVEKKENIWRAALFTGLVYQW